MIVTQKFLSLLFLLSFSLPCIGVESRIRVGTTGDYPPLTLYDEKTHTFSGQDVDLLTKFAEQNNLKIDWVKTEWENLSTDFQAGQFDVAIGGISATPKRANSFLFTVPLQRFGKTALVRCNDKSKYVSFDDIDKPIVTVVENIGGTNEEFARKHLRFAKLIVVKNNQLPFLYLIKKKADVMFTDSIEAVYIHQQQQEICIANKNLLLDSGNKIFMFSKRHKQLRDNFNTWFSNLAPKL